MNVDITPYLKEKFLYSDKKDLNQQLCENYLKGFEKFNQDNIFDETMNCKLENRAKELNSEIIDELEDLNNSNELLKDKLIESREEKKSLEKDKNNLENSQKENLENQLSIRDKFYEDQIESMRTSHKEDKNEYKDEICSLRSQVKEKDDFLTEYLTKDTHKNSHALGSVGEKWLGPILTSDSDFLVKDTHGESHKGDYVVEYKELPDRQICIDAKKWSDTVDREEVAKLISDVSENKFNCGAIISLHTSIIDPTTRRKTRNSVEIINVGCPILLLSNASDMTTDFINSLLKLTLGRSADNNFNDNLDNNISSETKNKCIIDFIKTEEVMILKSEKDIKNKKKKFDAVQRKARQDYFRGPLKKEEDDLKIRKMCLINLKTGYFNDSPEFDSPEIGSPEIGSPEIGSPEIDSPHSEFSEIGSSENDLSGKLANNNIKVITTSKGYPSNIEMRKVLQEVGYKNKDKDVRNLKRKELMVEYDKLIN